MYNVEEQGDPNLDPQTELLEAQYLIKWQNWSYLHNTWESRATLEAQRAKGIKKLDNYLARMAQAPKATSQCPEDAEYLACQAEMYDSLIDTHSLCERVIARSGGTDYFVKWQGLSYGECTVEDGDLVRRRLECVASINFLISSFFKNSI